MSKIRSSGDLSNIKDDKEFRRFCSIVINDIVSTVNGNLGLTENTDGSLQSVDFTSANAEVGITHNLNRLPLGYILAGSSVAMSLYDGVTPSDKKYIYLKSNAAGTAKIYIF